jgi:hypothetical protein
MWDANQKAAELNPTAAGQGCAGTRPGSKQQERDDCRLCYTKDRHCFKEGFRKQEIMSIRHEYQEQITRAQKDKPAADRGEAVSPLLRALERVALTIQEAEGKGGEQG